GQPLHDLPAAKGASCQPRAGWFVRQSRDQRNFMSDQLQALLQQTGAATPAFPANSRYNKTPLASVRMPDGTEVKYLRGRFVPPPENFALLKEHTVTEGERLDHIAAKYPGDPEQFWRLCDATGAIRPDELLEPIGHRIRITLPENIPGPQNE